jgi:hypothetical protein
MVTLMMGGLLAGGLLFLGIEFGYNEWSLVYAGALVGVYLLVEAVGLRSQERSSPGCFLILGVFLLGFVFTGVSYLGLLPELFSDNAWVLFGLAVVFCPVSVAWLMLESYYYQVYLRPALERDLGFRYNKCMEQITITHVQPGGLFDRAGVRAMDVVVDRVSITGFFRRLEIARGKDPIPITVVPWSDSPRVKDRPKRTVTVHVPPKDFGAELSRALGFQCEVYYPRGGDKRTGVLTIKQIRAGGVFDQAGFREGDIVVDGGGVTDFFARLENARGGEPITITVVPWKDAPPVRDRPAREIVIPPVHAAKGSDLEQDFGFKAQWRCIETWDGHDVVMTLEDIQPSGVFHQAGFHNQDIVLLDRREELYRLLKKARRGEPVAVRVVPWIDPPRLQDRPRRQLSLCVPR